MKAQVGSVLAESARSIRVRVPAEDQVSWFDGVLSDHHYLGAGRAVGDYLRQVVEIEGKPVALLVWGPACNTLLPIISDHLQEQSLPQFRELLHSRPGQCLALLADS